MYRSQIWSRSWDEYKASCGPRMSSSMEGNELPAYDSNIEMARKEKPPSKFASNAVHVIPLALIICGLILWFFSNLDVEVGNKPDAVTSRIEGLTIEGDIDTHSDGTQTGFLPIDAEELNKANQSDDRKSFGKLLKKLHWAWNFD